MLIEGMVSIPSSAKGQSPVFGVGAEYQWSEKTVFAVKGNDSLKTMEFGFKKEQFRGNGNDTLYGRLVAGTDDADQTKMDFAVGMRRKVDELSSVDVMVSNKDSVNMRYNWMSNELGLSGFIAAFFNLKDPRSRAKLQYGLFLEG